MILLEKFGALGGGGETLGGMVLMTPTSIAYTGTSASIGSNGTVTFSALSSLSLNNVFNTDYDNYLVAINDIASISAAWLCRLRVGGVDNSTASSYVSQELSALATTVSGSRDTQNYGQFEGTHNASQNGANVNFYGPFLTQPTAWRSVTVNARDTSRIRDYVVTHNQSTSYDGFTIYLSSGTSSGTISVYGLVGT